MLLCPTLKHWRSWSRVSALCVLNAALNLGNAGVSRQNKGGKAKAGAAEAEQLVDEEGNVVVREDADIVDDDDDDAEDTVSFVEVP